MYENYDDMVGILFVLAVCWVDGKKIKGQFPDCFIPLFYFVSCCVRCCCCFLLFAHIWVRV